MAGDGYVHGAWRRRRRTRRRGSPRSRWAGPAATALAARTASPSTAAADRYPQQPPLPPTTTPPSSSLSLSKLSLSLSSGDPIQSKRSGREGDGEQRDRKVDLHVGSYGPGPVRPSWRPPPLGRRPAERKVKTHESAIPQAEAASPFPLRTPFSLTAALCSAPSSKTLTPRGSPSAGSGSRSSPPSRRYTPPCPPRRFLVRPRLASARRSRSLLLSVACLAILEVDWLLNQPF